MISPGDAFDLVVFATLYAEGCLALFGLAKREALIRRLGGRP